VLGVVFAIAMTIRPVSLSSTTETPTEIVFGEEEAVRIMGEPVSMDEFLLYALDVVNGYELQYGEDIWDQMTTDIEGEEETVENVTKEEIVETIRLVKVLCSVSEEYGISLTEDEESVMAETADSYYESVLEAGVEDEDGSMKEAIDNYYRENYLSQKVYEYLQKNCDDYEEPTLINTASADAAQPADEDEELSSASVSSITDEMAELCASLVTEKDPDFYYKTSINWAVLDQFIFSKSEDASGDAAQ
jgi:hypothetical protein